MVADILARHQDPLDACKAIVQTAYEMWLQYEVRTDDISIIALYVDDVKSAGAFDHSSSFYVDNSGNSPAGAATPATPSSPAGANGTAAAAQTTSPSTPAAAVVSPTSSIEHLEARPVRRVMSREKKKNMIQLKSDDDDATTAGTEGEGDMTEEEIARLVTTKSPEEEKVILSAMKSNFLFQHLNATQRSAVVGLMKSVAVKKGDWVIRQGDAGDKFYIVDSGRYEVRVKAMAFPTEEQTKAGSEMSDEDKERVGGNVVHVYESGPDQHPGFGELSLM